MQSEHGHFIWNELNTRDAETAKSFYAASLGWTYDAMPDEETGGNYWICMDGEKPIGGIFTMNGPQFEGVPEHWLPYIGVDDIHKRVELAKQNGATILREPFNVEGVGSIAIIQEPGGAVLGWMTPAE